MRRVLLFRTGTVEHIVFRQAIKHNTEESGGRDFVYFCVVAAAALKGGLRRSRASRASEFL